MKSFYRVRQLVLLFGDFFSFIVGFIIALTLRHQALPNLDRLFNHVFLFGGMFLLWIVLNYINGLYDSKTISQHKLFYRRFIETAFLSLIASIIFFYILPQRNITPKTILVLTIFFGYSISAGWRLLSKKILGIKHLQVNIAFIGFTEEVRELISIITKNTNSGYQIKSVIDLEKKAYKDIPSSIDTYQSLRAIRPAITTHDINIVVIAPHMQEHEDAKQELYQLLFWPVQLMDLAGFYENITGRIPPFTFSEAWFLQHLRHTSTPVYEKIRILTDYFAAIVLSLILIVLGPFVALAIYLDTKGPVFFKQKRIGKGGREFILYKFRSMKVLSADGSAETDGYQFAKKGDARVTRIGKILRKLRLDELPQVINLWKRDISLIGPRPERPQIVRKLTEQMPYYPLRHAVRPGLTGWAVLHQNYSDTMEKSLQKLQYDLFYIKNKSLVLDLSIVLRTINVIIRGLGQ